MKIAQKDILYSKHKLNNKNKLDLTILLILRLSFPSTNYESLATQGYDENSKEKLEKRGERCLLLV